MEGTDLFPTEGAGEWYGKWNIQFESYKTHTKEKWMATAEADGRHQFATGETIDEARKEVKRKIDAEKHI